MNEADSIRKSLRTLQEHMKIKKVQIIEKGLEKDTERFSPMVKAQVELIPDLVKASPATPVNL